MIIYLKCNYNIIGKIRSSSEVRKYCFNLLCEDNSTVSVIIVPAENSLESSYEFNIPDENWTSIQNNLDGKDLPKEFKKTLLDKESDISNAAQKVLGLIKYCFGCTTLDENLLSITRISWSINKSEWKTVCSKKCVSINIQNNVNLNEKNAKIIQEYIDTDFIPFLALKHLHRAMNETNTRYKWIDATIAAELAIKEFLIKYVPTIETLLLEVPSPPLDKLYGTILENYTEERSPKLRELKKGVEMRNKLVHKPKDIKLTTAEANKYICDVETAIYHLLHLLYPHDNFINLFYELCLKRYTKASKPREIQKP